MTFRTTIDVRVVLLSAPVVAAALVGADAIFGGLEPGDFEYAWGFVVGELAALWSAWRGRDRGDALTKSPGGPVQ